MLPIAIVVKIKLKSQMKCPLKICLYLSQPHPKVSLGFHTFLLSLIFFSPGILINSFLMVIDEQLIHVAFVWNCFYLLSSLNYYLFHVYSYYSSALWEPKKASNDSTQDIRHRLMVWSSQKKKRLAFLLISIWPALLIRPNILHKEITINSNQHLCFAYLWLPDVLKKKKKKAKTNKKPSKRRNTLLSISVKISSEIFLHFAIL